MADLDRFRSFAERYIVARAACFRAGHEREDGWLATQDAKTIYNGIEAASRAEDVCDNRKAQQAGVAGNASQGPPGATGSTGPGGHNFHSGGGGSPIAKNPNPFLQPATPPSSVVAAAMKALASTIAPVAPVAPVPPVSPNRRWWQGQRK